MIKMPAILFILLLTFLSVSSQRTIKGNVVNHSNGEPLVGSSVFISNTSKGTVSDKLGYFELNDIPMGKHDLVVSSIGYETNAFSFSTEQLPLQLKIEMEVKVRELPNVTVEPSVEEGWDKWGKLFTDNFIGSTPNALQCKIKNQDAIHFRYYKKSNRLTAWSDEPVILENKALGYKINYQLEDFEVNFKSGSTAFAGYPFFEEMSKNRKKWHRNRDKSYYGSMIHFMRSIYQDSLSKEGFEVRRMVKVPNLEKERVKKIYNPVRIGTGSAKPDTLLKDSIEYYQRIMRQKDEIDVYGKTLLTADSLVVKAEGRIKVIYFTDYLYVTYKKEIEDKAYLAFHLESRSPTFQRSYIWLPGLKAITIDANGSYYPPQEIFSMAYWGWDEKIANMLPIDYKPGDE
jgi:hypothetical protein